MSFLLPVSVAEADIVVEPIKNQEIINGRAEYYDVEEEIIYLDDNVERPQVVIPKRKMRIQSEKTDKAKNFYSEKETGRYNPKDHAIGGINSSSGTAFGKKDNVTYGTTWDEKLSYSQLESSTGIFVRYDFQNRFSFDTALKRMASHDIGTQYGTVKFAPEWRITEQLTVKNGFTNYINSPKNKYEFTLAYSPALKKYAESLKFELGVAQSYNTGGRQSSSVSFSTGFKL